MMSTVEKFSGSKHRHRAGTIQNWNFGAVSVGVRQSSVDHVQTRSCVNAGAAALGKLNRDGRLCVDVRDGRVLVP